MKNKTTSRPLSLFLQFCTVLVIAGVFISLGLWQWDRAKQHQELERQLSEIASSEVTPMTSIFQPVKVLDGEIANRLITVEGRYLQFFLASNQANDSTLQVGLLEVEGSTPRAAILVARQISAEIEEVPSSTENITITARILPTQREDLDPTARGDLTRISRIDSALLVEKVADSSLALYDGFLLLNQESIGGTESALNLIPDQIAEPTVPGYYWQHISYVIIWFLMAGLVLYLPFYQIRRNKLLASENSEAYPERKG